MSLLYSVAGDGHTFGFTVNPAATATPVVGLYSDSGRTILVTACTVTGSGTSWTFTVPTSVPAGTYYLQITATTIGGTVVDAADTLIVTAASILVAGVVSLADVKAHLNMDPTRITDDAELQRFIAVAVAAIGNRTGPLSPVLVTERHDGGRVSIVLKKPRAVSLVTAADVNGPLDVTSLDLDPDTAVVYWQPSTLGVFTSGVRNITLSYFAGFAVVPDDLVQAVKELIRHLWETQRGNSNSRPGSVDTVVPGAFSSWPTRVQELVAPYAPPRIA